MNKLRCPICQEQTIRPIAKTGLEILRCSHCGALAGVRTLDLWYSFPAWLGVAAAMHLNFVLPGIALMLAGIVFSGWLNYHYVALVPKDPKEFG